MGRAGWCLASLLLLLQGCASAPAQAPLEEARQTYEDRARNRFETGDLTAAAYNFRRSVELAEMADDRVSLVTSLLNLGGTLSLLDRHADAGAAYRRAGELASLYDLPDLEVRASSGLAELAYRRGDMLEAGARYRRLIDHPGIHRHPMAHGSVLNGLALSLLAQGRLDEAERHLRTAESLLASLSASGQSATLLNRATLELRRGSLERAAGAARSALTIDRENGYTPGIAADLELLGQVMQRRGDHAGARLHFDQARNLYEQLGLRSSAARAQSLLKSLSP